MPNTIRIRRRKVGSGNAGAPSSLKNAELAFNEISKTLYYGVGEIETEGPTQGNATSILPIMGDGAVWTGEATFGTVNTTNELRVGEGAYAYNESDFGRKLLATLDYVDNAVSASDIAGIVPLGVDADCATTYPRLTAAADLKLASFATVQAVWLPTANGGDPTLQALNLFGSVTELRGLPILLGQQVQANDRVLIVNHPTPALRGIWVTQSGTWTRAVEENHPAYYTKGKRVAVANNSSIYAGKVYEVAITNALATNDAAASYANIEFVTLPAGETTVSNPDYERVVRVAAETLVLEQGKVKADGVVLAENDRVLWLRKTTALAGIGSSVGATWGVTIETECTDNQSGQAGNNKVVRRSGVFSSTDSSSNSSASANGGDCFAGIIPTGSLTLGTVESTTGTSTCTPLTPTLEIGTCDYLAPVLDGGDGISEYGSNYQITFMGRPITLPANPTPGTPYAEDGYIEVYVAGGYQERYIIKMPSSTNPFSGLSVRYEKWDEQYTQRYAVVDITFADTYTSAPAVGGDEFVATAGLYTVRYPADAVLSTPEQALQRAGDFNTVNKIVQAHNEKILVREGVANKQKRYQISTSGYTTLNVSIPSFTSLGVYSGVAPGFQGTPVIDTFQTISEQRAGNVAGGAVTSRGSVILVKDEVNPVYNGLYYIPWSATPATVPWVRHPLADEAGDLVFGSYIRVNNGATNKNVAFTQSGTGGDDEVITPSNEVPAGSAYSGAPDSIFFQNAQSGLDNLYGVGLQLAGRTVSVRTANPARITVTEVGVDLATVPSVVTDDTVAGGYLLAHVDQWGRVKTTSQKTLTASELRGKITSLTANDGTTGTGDLVFATSPSLVTPDIGTPSAGTLTNCSGLPVSGLSNLGTNVGTFLITPSSANLASAVTGTTGTGDLVFAAGPTFTGVPTAPKADGTTVAQIATVEYVTEALSAGGGSQLLGADNTWTGSNTFRKTTGTRFEAAANKDAIIVVGADSGTTGNAVTLTTASLTGNVTITLPNATGTVALTADKLSAFAATTSDELAGVISDETGSGSLVFATSPSLVTPNIGVATATSVNKLAITEPANGATLAIADGKTLTVSNTLTFTGTDASSVDFGGGGTAVYDNDSRLTDARTPTAHAHGNITDDGKVGSTANLPLITGTDGLVQAGSFGTTANTFCAGDDSRLSDTRAPSAGSVTTTSLDATETTGTAGKIVLSTSPTFSTSVITDSQTLSVFNTVATEVNAFGAATTLNFGAATGTTTIKNDLVVNGSLLVNGTTTVVNSTTVSIDDPIFTLGGPTLLEGGEDTALPLDSKDRGIEFYYRLDNADTSRRGFFGWDRDENVFTCFTDATNTSEVFSGTLASGRFSALKLDGATPTITTSAATASVFNTDTTTVNFGGAATTLNIGGATAETVTNIQTGTGTTNKTINIGTGRTGGTTTINIGPALSAGSAVVNLLTASTSTTTGAFVVSGGVGIGGRLNVGGMLTLAAGGTAANTAALKLQAGSQLTTPEAGAVEWDGSSLYITNSADARKTIAYTDSSITGNAANVTGVVDIANGGTGENNAGDAFDALAPTTTSGDLIYHNGIGNLRLPGSTVAEKRFLTQTGTGTGSAAPSWGSLDDADLPAEVVFDDEANTFTNAAGQKFQQAATNDAIVVKGRSGGSDSYSVTLETEALTANRTVTFPDEGGMLLTDANVCSVVFPASDEGCVVDGGNF